MNYKKETVIPFELADNLRDAIPVPPRLSGASMTLNDHVAKIEHICKCMFANTHSNIKIIDNTT